ncbi:MAG: molybdopterin-dependent oxidoreductase [Rhodopseudomonas sp.]|nr:molybdopterin-dependent oxidoreductase [Rhodopseudomonas sp.]
MGQGASSKSAKFWPAGAVDAGIGRAVRRREDAPLVTGAGRFIDDVSPADCLHLAFFRSTHARGAITQLDVETARTSPGVVAVFTGRDVVAVAPAGVNPLISGMKMASFSPLARGIVEAVGQPVAAVIGTSAEAARDAADSIVFGVDDSAGPDQVADNAAYAQRWSQGDCAEVFAKAAHVVRVDIDHARVAPMALEPRGAVAQWDEVEARLTVHLPTQAPHRARIDLASILGMPDSQIRIIAPDVGGAFGGKASIYPEDAVVAWAAKTMRRPVKWIASRSEDFLAATHGRGGRIEAALALSGDGRALGLQARLNFPLGHWMPYSSVVPGRNAGRILPGPYLIDTVEIELTGHLTNTAALGIYRGAGRPEACLVMERLMDRAAAVVNLDPLEIRRRNLISPDRLPFRSPTGVLIDAGDYPALIAKATERADYKALCRSRAKRRRRGEIVGIGTSLYIEPCGEGWESATIGLGVDGEIVLASGSSAQGQGRETAYAQIVCDVLKTQAGQVCVIHGDTARAPAGIGALASRGTPIGGSAVLVAVREFLTKATAVAAEMLNAATADIVPVNGGLALVADPAACVSWSAVAARAHAARIDVTDRLALTTAQKYQAGSEAWASGCCIALVVVDGPTGALTIEHVTWIDDAGVVVNPMLVEGQLRGGFAQGLGAVMSERLVYDTDGQLVTASLMDYAVPRAAHIPDLVIDKITVPSAANALGAKGVGEAGCIGVPAAILNAAIDALSPFGVTDLDAPLTSEKIWRALNQKHNNGGRSS